MQYLITLADDVAYDAALDLITRQDNAALRGESSKDRQLSLDDPADATLQALRDRGATVELESSLGAPATTL